MDIEGHTSDTMNGDRDEYGGAIKLQGINFQTKLFRGVLIAVQDHWSACIIGTFAKRTL